MNSRSTFLWVIQTALVGFGSLNQLKELVLEQEKNN